MHIIIGEYEYNWCVTTPSKGDTEVGRKRKPRFQETQSF